jgi:hypothetical protein
MTEAEKLQSLREAIELGIQSLDRGEGRELTLEQILRLARARWAEFNAKPSGSPPSQVDGESG